MVTRKSCKPCFTIKSMLQKGQDSRYGEDAWTGIAISAKEWFLQCTYCNIAKQSKGNISHWVLGKTLQIDYLFFFFLFFSRPDCLSLMLIYNLLYFTLEWGVAKLNESCESVHTLTWCHWGANHLFFPGSWRHRIPGASILILSLFSNTRGVN